MKTIALVLILLLPFALADESCNNLDDDNDGFVDENLVRPCGSNVGQCEFGKQYCVAGKWSWCGEGFVPPTEEECDGIDNDCNGIIDDTCPTPTSITGSMIADVSGFTNWIFELFSHLQKQDIRSILKKIFTGEY